MQGCLVLCDVMVNPSSRWHHRPRRMLRKYVRVRAFPYIQRVVGIADPSWTADKTGASERRRKAAGRLQKKENGLNDYEAGTPID
jgi:hypothetical protein